MPPSLERAMFLFKAAATEIDRLRCQSLVDSLTRELESKVEKETKQLVDKNPLLLFSEWEREVLNKYDAAMSSGVEPVPSPAKNGIEKSVENGANESEEQEKGQDMEKQVKEAGEEGAAEAKAKEEEVAG